MKKILIVDDDAIISGSLCDVLEEKSFSTVVLNQIEGALENIERIHPDLLLLDVMFPENPSAGFDLAREIRKNSDFGKLPIIFITSVNKEFPMDFSVKDMDDNWFPAQDFVEKPINFNELMQKIDKLIGR